MERAALETVAEPAHQPFTSACTAALACVLRSARAADDNARAFLVRRARVLHALGEALRLAALVAPSEPDQQSELAAGWSAAIGNLPAHPQCTDVEVRAETAAAALSLLEIYRDCAPGPDLQRTRNAHAGSSAESDQGRPGTTKRALIVMLEALRAVSLLAEMRARRRGEPRRAWRTITLIEVAKAAIRLAMLVEKNGHQLAPGDETLPRQTDSHLECNCGMVDALGDASTKVSVSKGARTGRTILRMAGESPAHEARSTTGSGKRSFSGPDYNSGHTPDLDPLFHAAYERRAAWLMRLLVPSDDPCPVCEPHVPPEPEQRATENNPRHEQLRSRPPPSQGRVLAEVLYILRPVLHLLLIRRYGWNSWKAWAASLAIDTASLQLHAPDADHDDSVELQRRSALMLLYFARSPAFDFASDRVLRRTQSVLRRIPLLGSATGSAVDLLCAFQQFWFYVSAS